MPTSRLSRAEGAPCDLVSRYRALMAGEDLFDAVSEALAIVVDATGLSSDELFGERVLGELTHLPPPAAHAAGVLEGIGVALGLTTLELLDELGLGQ